MLHATRRVLKQLVVTFVAYCSGYGDSVDPVMCRGSMIVTTGPWCSKESTNLHSNERKVEGEPRAKMIMCGVSCHISPPSFGLMTPVPATRLQEEAQEEKAQEERACRRGRSESRV
jgi:hypothetical protein